MPDLLPISPDLDARPPTDLARSPADLADLTAGVLAIVLGAMRDDVLYFSVILFVLTFGFGVTFAVLLPASMSEEWYRVLGANPLWGPFWGVFGGFDVSGPLELEAGHEPTTTLVPVLLWLYQFAATSATDPWSRLEPQTRRCSARPCLYLARRELLLTRRAGRSPRQSSWSTCSSRRWRTRTGASRPTG